MRKFLKIIFFLFLTFCIFAVHFFVAYTFPYPYDKINILFLYLLFYLLFTESGMVVWLCFLTHILLEIFPNTLFGVTLISSCLSLLIAYWMSLYYITSKRWYGAVSLLALTLFLYRILFALFSFVVSRMQGSQDIFPWGQLLGLVFWENVLTCSVFFFIYFLFYRFSRRFYHLVTH